MRRLVHIQGMWGLGDNIYQRPFVEAVAQECFVYLDTPWPEIYEDIPNVRFVKGQRNLRTQLKNIHRQPAERWARVPPGVAPMRIHYNLSAGSIVEEMRQCFRVGDRVALSLPPRRANWPQNGKPIAVVRPVTVRQEWHNPARNPLPEYVAAAAARLMQTHHVIALADLSAQETLVGQMPPCHEALVHGEVATDRLLDLIAAADVLVGGVGWIVPAAVAAGKRAFIIQGGQGGHNAPEKILAPWWQHKLTFAQPQRFCRCSNMRHECAKTIPNIDQLFSRFLSQPT